MEVIVNNCVIARGEVVVVEGNVGIRIKRVISRQKRLQGLSSAELSPLELRLRPDDLTGRLQEAEQRFSAAAPGASHIRPSFNLNKRNQVIRMSGPGQAAAIIAASLSLPRKEVELLLKIHNLASQDAPQAPA